MKGNLKDHLATSRYELRLKAARIIKTKLSEWELPLTYENIRRVFAQIWRQVPDDKVVKAIYDINI